MAGIRGAWNDPAFLSYDTPGSGIRIQVTNLAILPVAVGIINYDIVLLDPSLASP
jgi:hypothetical protein